MNPALEAFNVGAIHELPLRMELASFATCDEKRSATVSLMVRRNAYHRVTGDDAPQKYSLRLIRSKSRNMISGQDGRAPVEEDAEEEYRQIERDARKRLF